METTLATEKSNLNHISGLEFSEKFWRSSFASGDCMQVGMCDIFHYNFKEEQVFLWWHIVVTKLWRHYKLQVVYWQIE